MKYAYEIACHIVAPKFQTKLRYVGNTYNMADYYDIAFMLSHEAPLVLWNIAVYTDLLNLY